MKERANPTVTIKTPAVRVTRACIIEYSRNAFASTPAVDEETTRVTTGSNQIVLICSREWV